MSDDRFPPPDGDADDPFAPPSGPESSGESSEPLDAISDDDPNTELLAGLGGGEETTMLDSTPVGASRPPEPTQVIPVVPTLPGVSADAVAPPGGSPPSGPYTTAPPLRPDPVPPTDRRPAWIFGGAFLVVALIGGLLIFALTRGGDDDSLASDDGSGETVRLIANRFDETGLPVLMDQTATVFVGPTGSAPFEWRTPADIGATEAATRRTDAAGRTEFRWGPVAGDDVATWTSTVDLREPWPDPTLVPPTAACFLEQDGARRDIAASVTVLPGEADPDLPTAPVIGELVTSFPNLLLAVGDTVSCDVRGVVPPTFDPNVPGDTTTTTSLVETTTIPETTTTVADTTTTTAETTTTTTVPETTTTTTSTTTTTTTTTTSTTTTSTTTTTTVPTPTITDVLRGDGELDSFVAIIEASGLVDEFDAPDRQVTVFAPTDDAIAALLAARPDLDPADTTDARLIVLAHTTFDEGLSAADLAALPFVRVANGLEQPVESITPLIIGGATVERSDLTGLDAIGHVVGASLPLEP